MARSNSQASPIVPAKTDLFGRRFQKVSRNPTVQPICDSVPEDLKALGANQGQEKCLPPSQESSRVLRSIIADPDSLPLRLKYADLLRDKDPEQAAFIENQVWLARRGWAPQDVEWRRRSREARETEQRQGRNWAPQLLKDPSIGLDYSRGLVERVEMDAAAFLDKAAAIWNAAPIRHLDLHGVKAVAERFARWPDRTLLRSLDLSHNDLEDTDIAQLFGTPDYPELRWLSLVGNRITRAGAEILARATQRSRLPKLEYAMWTGNPFDPTDDPVYDHGVVTEVEVRMEALALEADYGALAWLHREVSPDGRLIPPMRL